MEHSLIRMNGIIVGDEYDSRTRWCVFTMRRARHVCNTIVDRCSDGVRWCQFQFIFFFALDRRYLRRNVGLEDESDESEDHRNFQFIFRCVRTKDPTDVPSYSYYFIVEQTTWLQHLVEVLSSTKASPSFRSRRRRGLCGRK